MEPSVTRDQARAALLSVEHERRRVIDEIDLPTWYWWTLAGAWICFGVLSDLAVPWVSAAATLAFGAAHASIAGRVIDGRHRTSKLRVSVDTAGPRVPALVIAGMLLMVVVTIAAALAVDADGARHPSIIASVFVATIVALGGPQLLRIVRRRAGRAVVAS